MRQIRWDLKFGQHAWRVNVWASGIRRAAYTQTEHYQITREFLNNTDKMLDIPMEP